MRSQYNVLFPLCSVRKRKYVKKKKINKEQIVFFFFFLLGNREKKQKKKIAMPDLIEYYLLFLIIALFSFFFFLNRDFQRYRGLGQAVHLMATSKNIFFFSLKKPQRKREHLFLFIYFVC